METIGGARCERGRSQAAGPTSGLVELQGDVSVEAQAEVVVEHIQGQLGRQEKGQKVTSDVRSQHVSFRFASVLDLDGLVNLCRREIHLRSEMIRRFNPIRMLSAAA